MLLPQSLKVSFTASCVGFCGVLRIFTKRKANTKNPKPKRIIIKGFFTRLLYHQKYIFTFCYNKLIIDIMENVSPENQLLKRKYDLHKQPEVNAAARRTLAHTGEKIPQDPLARIGNYLNRFREITDRTEPKEREHG